MYLERHLCLACFCHRSFLKVNKSVCYAVWGRIEALTFVWGSSHDLSHESGRELKEWRDGWLRSMCPVCLCWIKYWPGCVLRCTIFFFCINIFWHTNSRLDYIVDEHTSYCCAAIGFWFSWILLKYQPALTPVLYMDCNLLLQESRHHPSFLSMPGDIQHCYMCDVLLYKTLSYFPF